MRSEMLARRSAPLRAASSMSATAIFSSTRRLISSLRMPGVGRLVEAVTKRPTPGMRKDEINRLVEEKMAVADIDEAALKGADLLANISDLILDQRQQGYAHWEKVFKNRRRANLKVGHYITLASIITERLGSQNAFPVLVSHLQTRAGELQRLYEDWDS